MGAAPRSWRARLLSAATGVQTGTAVTLGSVLVTHLATPVVAGLVGPDQLDLANQTMLLGRVFYQNAFLEPMAVWGALGGHLIASAVRRALLGRPRVRRGGLAAWHTAAGYLLLPALLVHLWTNRVAPMSAAAPIAELSPSELDLSFVGYGFSTPRLAAYSTVAYALLIGAAVVHGIGGAPKMALRLTGKRVRARTALLASGGAASLLALGTAAVARAGVAGVAPRMLPRMHAAYACVWPFL